MTSNEIRFKPIIDAMFIAYEKNVIKTKKKS